MNQIEYWRDVISKLLGWGTGFLILIAGWGVDKGAFFEFSGNNIAAKQRAFFLLLYAVIYGVGLVMSVSWIYSKHLNQSLNSTVIPRFVAIGYSVFLSASFIGLALLMGYF